MFWKYVANLQENTHAEIRFQYSLRHGCSPAKLLHIFRTPLLRTPLGGCFWKYKLCFFNPFHSTSLFLYTLKILENFFKVFLCFDVFSGYIKRPVAWNELKSPFWNITAQKSPQENFGFGPIYWRNSFLQCI